MTTKQDVEQAEAKLVSLYHDTNKHRADISLKLDLIEAWENYNTLKIENEVLGACDYTPTVSLPIFKKLLGKIRLYYKKYC